MIYNKCPRCGSIISIKENEISYRKTEYLDKVINMSSGSSIVQKYCPNCGYLCSYKVEMETNKSR